MAGPEAKTESISLLFNGPRTSGRGSRRVGKRKAICVVTAVRDGADGSSRAQSHGSGDRLSHGSSARFLGESRRCGFLFWRAVQTKRRVRAEGPRKSEGNLQCT